LCGDRCGDRGHRRCIVTGPIQKEAWMQAGIEFSGHTELLADRTGATVTSALYRWQ